MNYELAKQLKEAGFPQSGKSGRYFHDQNDTVYLPTLEELIEACKMTKDNFSFHLDDRVTRWAASIWIDRGVGNNGKCFTGEGSTPTEAVANLWLALNKN